MRIVGTGELHLNHATLQTIIEEWLRRDSINGQSSPTVTAVAYHAGTHMLIATLAERKGAE